MLFEKFGIGSYDLHWTKNTFKMLQKSTKKTY